MTRKFFLKIFILLIFCSTLYSQELFFPPENNNINNEILFSIKNLNASITLTRIPTKFYRNKDFTSSGDITITWEQSGIYGNMYFSRFPNVASSQFPRRKIKDLSNSDKKTTFNVGRDSVSTGIYYCIISDSLNPDSTSIEFNMIIEHNLSAHHFEPNGDTTTTNTGYLEWQTADPFVPFYHLIVSNRPMRLEDTNGDGDDEVIGINVIYQTITSNKHITYRDTDPSGFFNNTKSPRLASGNKYYWLLFNNYGNNPALSSDVVSYAEAPRFVYYDDQTYQPAPHNIEPVNTGMTNIETFKFKWTSVPGSNYHLYLYEENEERGSVGSFLIYDTTMVTGDTSFIWQRANQILINANYYWNVTAENGLLFSASRIDSFAYTNVNSGHLNVRTKHGTIGNLSLARVNLYIQLMGVSSSPMVYLTDESGKYQRDLIEGNYRIIATKEGFRRLDTTITIIPAEIMDLELIMGSNPTYFTGIIQIPDNNVIPQIHLLSQTIGDTFSVFGTKRLSGSTAEYTFRANVEPGDWTLYPIAEGFQAMAGDTADTTIQFGDYITTQIFDLEELPSRITIDVINNSGLRIYNFNITFEKDPIQQTFLGVDPPFTHHAEPGTWTVSIEKQDFFSQSDRYEVVVIDGQTSNLNIIMIEAGTLSGIVRNDIGQPLDFVRIQAFPQDGYGRFAETISGLGGIYGPLPLKPGQYQIKSEKNGYSSADTIFTIKENEKIYYNPILVKNRSFVTGIVSDTSDLPLSGARVKYIFGFGSGFTPPTESKGAYTLAVPSDVPIKVFAEKSGYVTSDTAFLNVPENQSVTQNFTLLKLSSIVTGVIKTVDQFQLNPVAGVLVTAIDTASKQIIYVDSTDISGNFKVYVDAGIFWLRVSHENYITYQDTLTLSRGDSLAVIYIINKHYGSVSGLVTTNTSIAVANQIVTARRVSTGSLFYDTTDVSGVYRFVDLEPKETYDFKTTKIRYRTEPSDGYTYRIKPGVDSIGFDFVLSQIQVTSLEIRNWENIELYNTNTTQFDYFAYSDSIKVNIESPVWRVEYPDTLIYQTAKFSETVNGLFIPKIDALDANFSISVEDPISGIKEIKSGFPISANLYKDLFSSPSFELKDHTGLVFKIDSTDINTEEGITIKLSRENIPVSKAISTDAESYGDSYNLTLKKGEFLNSINLTLPVPQKISTGEFEQNRQGINLGKWNPNFLEWDVLINSNIETIPYFKVSNTIDGEGEYIVLITSKPLGINNLKLLPNPFSPNLVNFNDPNNRGLTGQIVLFDLTSLDIRRPFVTLKIYNMNGELVRVIAEQDPIGKGELAIIWDGRTNSGVMARNGRYIIHLKVKDSTGEKEEIRSSVLIK